MRISIVLSALLLAACGGGSGSEGPEADRSGVDVPTVPAEPTPSDDGPFAPGPDVEPNPVPEPDPGPDTDPAPNPGSDPLSGPEAAPETDPPAGPGAEPVAEPDPPAGPDVPPDMPPDDDPVVSPSPDPASLPPDGVLDTENYRSLTAFAVQMNIVILSDRDFSPTIFLDRFPGNPRDALASVAESELRRIESDGDCPLGGTYEALAERTGIPVNLSGTYVDCATGAGTLNGSYAIEVGQGGSLQDREYDRETYDLELGETSGPDGPGTTVFEARYEAGRFGNVSFDVENYSRDTERNPFAVSGSGQRSLVRAHDTETVVRLQGESGPIDLEITTSGLSVDAPLEGTLSLVARDGSRVDVILGETPGTASLTLVDRDGATFTDTVAWSDLYQPPDEPAGE